MGMLQHMARTNLFFNVSSIREHVNMSDRETEVQQPPECDADWSNLADASSNNNPLHANNYTSDHGPGSDRVVSLF
jgi:hypothetical protein